jgi:hypothetical protein
VFSDDRDSARSDEVSAISSHAYPVLRSADHVDLAPSRSLASTLQM